MPTPANEQRFHVWINARIVLVVAWICCCATICGQPARPLVPPQNEFMVKAWSMADGLPHPSVTALAQTRDGYIWIGTLAGLVRFDGVRFKVYTPQNCPELPRSRIGRLFEGADGTLFITTERGGGLVALRGGKFQQLLGSGNEQDEIVSALNEGSGSSLFVARSGALWRWADGRLTTVSTNRAFYPVSRSHVCEDGQGKIWMVSGAHESRRLLRFDSGHVEPILLEGPLAGSRIQAITKDAHGQIWLGTSKGLAALREGRFERMELPGPDLTASITHLAPSRDGGLWVCGANYWQQKYHNGRWVGATSRIQGVQTSLELLGEDRWGNLCFGKYPEGFVTVSPEGTVTKLDPRNGLPGTTVSCYLADREGNEWLGLFDGGLVRLQPRRFSILGGPLLTTPVYAVCEDPAGDIWVGSSFGGVYRFQGADATRFGPGDLPLTDVWSIFADSRSNLWIGTSSHGVFQFRGGRFVSMFDRSRISDRVNAIHEDRRGRIWFGHWGGLACYANGELARVPMPWFSDEYEVVAIAEDKLDRLWLGTKGAGLLCLQDGKFTSYTMTNGLPSNLAWSLFVDRHDTLWIGTADGGLSCWRGGRFVNITTREGLADNTVCHILEDSMGRFWFSSPHGVFSAHRSVLEAFVRGERPAISCTLYGQSDGMLSAACTCAFQPSGCVTRDGRLLFPTLKGVAVVRPDAIVPPSLSPPVFIEEVTIGGKVHAVNGPETFTTTPGRSRLEIRYTAVNFSAPEKVRFKYRMEGLDAAWVDYGTKRVVDYPYLPHGRYRFQVLASNDDGLSTPQIASIELVVPPHFWETWWFMASLLLTGGVGIALTARRLEKTQAQRRLERQQQAHLVELERARIARDFHDDIGSYLTHVIVLSELVKSDQARAKEVEAHATMIGNTARKAVRGLGTIIWAANPRNDTLDSLVQYISQYSYDFFQGSPVLCHLDLPPEVPALPLTAEVRHNLFMVVKEALHNILKHAHASEVRLSLNLYDAGLELQVNDDGRGFNVDSVAAGQRSGLGNMRHRMQAIGAILAIHSTPGAGTSIRVRWKYPKQIPPV
ncbi:MAG TPA: two-component regulator propeller domain-containing protein [Verrucomicrobiae bacterium]|nr:two-component regulator propeller domain-containing protein [Verrucomicrobiae bacterium]